MPAIEDYKDYRRPGICQNWRNLIELIFVSVFMAALLYALIFMAAILFE